MRRAYAYLTKTRWIDPDVVQDFVDRKMLYQDVKGNCVFLAYGADGEPGTLPRFGEPFQNGNF